MKRKMDAKINEDGQKRRQGQGRLDTKTRICLSQKQQQQIVNIRKWLLHLGGDNISEYRKEVNPEKRLSGTVFPSSLPSDSLLKKKLKRSRINLILMFYSHLQVLILPEYSQGKYSNISKL